jgi:hypothetical protein
VQRGRGVSELMHFVLQQSLADEEHMHFNDFILVYRRY